MSPEVLIYVEENQPNELQGIPGSEYALVSINLAIMFLWHSLIRLHVNILGCRLVYCLYEVVHIDMM